MHDSLARLTPWLLWAAGAAAAGAVLLLAATFWVQQRRLRRQRRAGSLAEIWSSILQGRVRLTPRTLPRVAPRDLPLLIEPWLRARRTADAHAAARLDTIGRAIGLDALAVRLLVDRDRPRRALAIAIAAYLKPEAAWDHLCALADESEPLRSVAACWALLQINPTAIAPRLARLVVQRDDWTPELVRGLLADAPRQLFFTAIGLAAERTKPPAWPRLLRILADLGGDCTPALARRALLELDEAESIAAALRTLCEPGDADLALAHLQHPVWFVRVQAVAAIGRIGAPSARAALRSSLYDPEWWVRQRAAEAIAALDRAAERQPAVESPHQPAEDSRRFAEAALLDALTG